MTGWLISVRASENEDGTGADKFFDMEKPFSSLKKAIKYAKKYEKRKPPWLRELRIYRATEGEF